MAVVYPTTDDPNVQPVHPGLLQEAETHPIWAVVILGGLAVVGYALLSRLRGGSSTTSQPTAASQPTTEYVPTANYFINDYGSSHGAGTPGGPLPPVPGPGNGNGGGNGGGSGDGGGQPPQGPPPPQGPGNGYNGTPLIPYGDYTGPGYGAGQFHWGQEFTYNGTTYQEGPGSNGLLWGVALKPGETPLTQAQWNNIPIAPGGKALLYGPQSKYPPAKGGGPPVAWASDYSRQRPVLI